MAPNPMLSPGQTVERYTVEAVIGQGGMAVVYRVRHNQLGSLHALKILTVPKPNIRERLLAEGRAQAVIRHLNVVSVTDVLELGNAPALLMEYVEGPTLEALLEAQVPSLEVAEELFRGICAGVGEAHAHGMVHRDLKPSNVLLAPKLGPDAGTGFIPKVTDFGIAKVLAGDEPDKKTRTNVAMGTPHYMAPEQIRDAKSVDPRADVFSLGVLLYELICGERPFDGTDVLMVLNSVASGKFKSPREFVPDLPDRFDNAIRRALDVDRETRLQNCSALIAVLSGHEPVEMRPTWNPGSTGVDQPPPPVAQYTPPTFTAAGGVAAPNTPATADNAPPQPLGEPTADMIAKETPSFPIDPNAMTVPRTQRIETPMSAIERDASARRSFGLVLVGLAVVAGLGGVGLFGYFQEQSATALPTDEDGAVLGVTQHKPAADVEVRPVPDVPVDTDSTVPAPGVLSDPSKRPPPVTIGPKPVAPSAGLGLFGPKDKPPDPKKGRVVITGDVKSQLYIHGQSLAAVEERDLPPGKYDIRAAFPGQSSKVAMELELRAGEVLRVDCSSTWQVCQRVP